MVYNTTEGNDLLIKLGLMESDAVPHQCLPLAVNGEDGTSHLGTFQPDKPVPWFTTYGSHRSFIIKQPALPHCDVEKMDLVFHRSLYGESFSFFNHKLLLIYLWEAILIQTPRNSYQSA